MKSIQYLICLWPLLMGQIYAQSGTITFNIQVDSKEINEITLSKYLYETEKMSDLKTIRNVSSQHQCNFEDQVSEPTLYRLKLNTGKEIRIAVEDPGQVLLRLGNEITVESKVAAKSDFAQTIQELNASIFKELIKEYDKALSENDQHTITRLEERKTILLIDFVQAMEEKVRQMGASAQAYDALAYFDLHKNYDFLQQMSELFQSEYPGSGMSRSVQKRMKKAALVAQGNKAPEFSATLLDGTTTNLADFKGSFLLIDFWASWCRACRVENSKFLDIYNTYAGKGFEIVSVSIDEDSEQWKKAIEKDALSWTQILDTDQSIYNTYMLSSLPSNFLLDQEGKIIAKNIVGAELKILLQKLVNN